MKKVVLNAFLLGVMFVGFTSCESDNLDEEISTGELQLVDPDNDGSVDEEEEDEY